MSSTQKQLKKTVFLYCVFVSLLFIFTQSGKTLCQEPVIDPGYNVLTDFCEPEKIQEVRLYLTETLGYNKAVASGIVTNMVAESKLEPDCYGDHLASYGICQWNDDRLKALEDFCLDYSADITDLYVQLMYFSYDITTNFPTLEEYLRELPDSDYGARCAAQVICKQYEVPTDLDAEVEKRVYMAIWDYVYGTPDAE